MLSPEVVSRMAGESRQKALLLLKAGRIEQIDFDGLWGDYEPSKTMTDWGPQRSYGSCWIHGPDGRIMECINPSVIGDADDWVNYCIRKATRMFGPDGWAMLSYTVNGIEGDYYNPRK